jgi:hypothetical protein
MNMTARNTIATKPTIKLRKGLSNFRCINQVKTSPDLMVAKIMAPSTEYAPRLILIIPIDKKVSTINAARI